MGGRLERQVEPVLTTMESTRNQWASIKSGVEADRARIDQVRSMLRGALGSRMLTGQQGEAFDRAIDRYRYNSLAAGTALDEMIGQLDNWVSNMRSATQDTDRTLLSGFLSHVDDILDHILPDLSAVDMIIYGESVVHHTVSNHRQSILGLIGTVEQVVIQEWDDAISGIERAVAELANGLSWCARQWGDAVHAASEVLNAVLGDVEVALPVVEEFLNDSKVGQLLKDLDENPTFKSWTFLIGFLTDFGKEKDWTPYNYFKDLVGNSLGVLVGLSEVGTAVGAEITAMQMTSTVAGWVQGFAADALAKPGTILNQDLGTLSQNWATTASNLDIGHVLDDWGAVGVDAVMTDVTGVASRVDPQLVSPSVASHWVNKTVSDTGNALGDSARLGVGVYQFKVNAQATIMSDTAAATNFVVQRAPFPPSLKAATALSTTLMVQNMTDVSNLVTNGQLPPNAPPPYKAALMAETATMAVADF